MANVADYSIVADAPFIVNTNVPTFDLDHPNTQQRAVLMFKLDLSPGTNLSLSVAVNGQEVFTGSFASGVVRTLHEALPSNLLHGSNNVIHFSGTGTGATTAKISDVVVLYQHTV